jgi:hypothetical protein
MSGDGVATSDDFRRQDHCRSRNELHSDENLYSTSIGLWGCFRYTKRL